MARPRTQAFFLSVAAAIILSVGAIEYAMGRTFICTCGYVKLWHGAVFSSENSQHLTDWYSFTHVAHGFLFYALFWLYGRVSGKSVAFHKAVLAAMVLEGGWEILENTDFIINRYRTATIALDYYGDSIINSVSDIAAMLTGFWLARTIPVWISVIAVLTMELGLAYAIHDNLALNVLMLLYPVEFIKQWQQAL